MCVLAELEERLLTEKARAAAMQQRMPIHSFLFDQPGPGCCMPTMPPPAAGPRKVRPCCCRMRSAAVDTSLCLPEHSMPYHCFMITSPAWSILAHRLLKTAICQPCRSSVMTNGESDMIDTSDTWTPVHGRRFIKPAASFNRSLQAGWQFIPKLPKLHHCHTFIIQGPLFAAELPILAGQPTEDLYTYNSQS